MDDRRFYVGTTEPMLLKHCKSLAEAVTQLENWKGDTRFSKVVIAKPGEKVYS